MASFGHVAVGLLTGRLHGGGDRSERRSRWGTLALFTILSTLPDLDVLLVALGASETGPFGHRGALHSLTMACAAGVFCAVAARRWRWPVLRTALAGAAAVASHTLLDLLGAGGKNLTLFWPLSSARFHSPWRFLPDSPRGLKLLSGTGLLEFVTEFALFLPITLYALWPQIRARLLGMRPPRLQVIDGASTAKAAPDEPASSARRDPPLRSSG
jgi:inner membrane protein